MEESRIRQLAADVLSQVRGPAGDLEARVAALEEAVAALTRSPRSEATIAVSELHLHPSLRLLGVSTGAAEGRCCLEPDKPCVGSGQCRVLGH